MGGSISNLFNNFWSNKEVKIFIGGLDAAGKTTILYMLKLGKFINTIPTTGFNVETVQYKNINFTAWDGGGGCKIRPLFKHYYPNTQALIFVIDSTDHERFDEINEELQKLFREDDLKATPILIFANKQDLPNAMSADEIAERIHLNSIKNRKWHIEEASAKNGSGLYEGLEWLSQNI